jgi:predicted AlkP superfamily phosphohydrolase/phosphomutase
MPTTFPPREIPNGRIVAGGPLCADSGYTADSAFEQLLEQKFGYKVRPEVALTSNEDSGTEVEQLLSLIELRFDVLEWYLDKHDPDVAHATIFLLNILQHYFWNEKPVKEAWKRIDEGIGRIEDQTDNIVLMSDHGCSPVHTVFHINTWLENDGYLDTETGLTTYLKGAGLTKERVSAIVERLGIRTLARGLPRSVKNMFPQEDEGAKREAKSRMIDWNATEVVGSGQGPLYFKSGSKKEAIKADIAEKLTALNTPSGQPVASEVFDKEDAYQGKHLNTAPDQVIDQAPGIHISDGVGVDTVFDDPSRWNAENDRDGLFLVAGEAFSSGNRESISIKDIAPTVLHLMDLSIPRDMEGNVLDVFESKEIDPEYREPINITGEKISTGSEVEGRLEDLGYIGQ